MNAEERLNLALENVQISVDPTYNKPYYYCSLNNRSGWTLDEIIGDIVGDPVVLARHVEKEQEEWVEMPSQTYPGR